MLDHDNIVPLYHQLKELLEKKIKDKSWREEEKVPSERELMDIYKVSRSTARKALESLMNEGLIYKRQGVGTFVSKSKVNQQLIGEYSFNEQAIRNGMNPSSIVLSAKVEENKNNSNLELFNSSVRDKIIKVVRVRCVDNKPLVLEFLYIPLQSAPKLMSQNLSNLTIFKYLEEECNIHFTHSVLEIEPVLTNEYESQNLGIEVNSLALSLDRVIYIQDSVSVIQKRIMRSDLGKVSFTLEEMKKNKRDYVIGFALNNLKN